MITVKFTWFMLARIPCLWLILFAPAVLIGINWRSALAGFMLILGIALFDIVNYVEEHTMEPRSIK